MVVCISMESVVISSLLFFIAYILLFSLFLFINVASGLSILLIFPKNQLLDLLIFKGFFCLCLLQLCSDLNYFLSSASFWIFLILLISSFNSDDRVLILDLSLLLMWAFIAINFLLNTALNVSQIFWYVVTSFWLVSKNIFCLHFIIYPVNIQEPVVQFPWSCAVLGLFLNSEF